MRADASGARPVFVALFGCALGCAGTVAPRSAAVLGAATDDPVLRATRLVARLTLDEKVAQLETAAPAIPRLGIPAYDWWSESLHGIARNGIATVFPQVIGLGATFDEALVRRVAEAIAEEGRAKFEARVAAAGGGAGTGRYQGLTFFAPNLNLFRDPRWGRGQETFGEDPFLTARLGVAYVRGLQESPRPRANPHRRLEVAAVAKHFAVHSGPELDRHHFDARVDARDLAESYLPQFEAVVREGQVAGVMAAYNAINGVPAVANRWLLGDLLRTGWGFQGFVVGDCGAVGDLVTGHRRAANPADAAALALAAGTDLDCGRTYHHLGDALATVPPRIPVSSIDAALVRLFTVRFQLGVLDPVGSTAHAAGSKVETGAREDAFPGRFASGSAPAEAEMRARHRALAREAAVRSMVLLSNPSGVLPLDGRSSGLGSARRLAVIGPTADDVAVLLGNYHGTPQHPVTFLAGLRDAARARGVAVEHVRGVTLAGRGSSNLAAAEAAARRADVVIACLGLSPALEGEEGDPDSLNPAGDRPDLGLPGLQPLLLARLLATGRPVVVVLTGGGALALPVQDSGVAPAAVLMAWYPGEEGGTALADLLFGAESPSGRLPVTFYASVRDLPTFTDYRMRGRTYRYFAGAPAFPFGHGLGYGGAIGLQDLVATLTAHAVEVSLVLVNASPGARPFTVPIFVEPAVHQPDDPRLALAAFRRIVLAPRATVPLTVEIPLSAFHRTDADGQRAPAPGAWLIHVGTLDATPLPVLIPARPARL